MLPEFFFSKINVKIAYFSAFLEAEMVSCSGIKAGLGIGLKYITKVTLIIGSNKILNRPHACSQPRTIHLIKHLSKAEVHFLCFAVFVLFEMYNYLINFRPGLLGVPLQLGALSARLVRLWVNPALNVTVYYVKIHRTSTTFLYNVNNLISKVAAYLLIVSTSSK